MNIAIVIGVSKYTDPKNNLPGCKNDADAINTILQKTEKFNNILTINNNETSAKTKELITNFVAENRGKAVDEFFFYYSGHGEFLNEEFYYILSDFDNKKRNQSTLRNSEMDDLIRSLSPNLVIKIIDACQSGATYIKDINILNKYFNESKQIFKKCYFLNSSLNTQSSYQDKILSNFTKSFIVALKDHGSAEIRYRDIIDVISDEFSNTPEQTPFFVIQADFTEKFCAFSSDLRNYLNSILLTDGSQSTKSNFSIADLIKQDAKDYVDKNGALNSLNLIKSEIESKTLKNDLIDLYNIKVNFLEDHQNIPKKNAIVTYINKNKNEYFATAVYAEEINPFNGELEDHLIGFDLKIETSYKAISIDIISSYPNLLSYNCSIVFLLSRKNIRFFYFISNYILEGWEEMKLNTRDLQWVTTEYKIGNVEDIRLGINNIFDAIQNKIENDINDKFNVKSSEEQS